MGERWRRLGPEALPGPAAVARPLGLLDRMGAGDVPVLSWSTTTAPALVLGRAAADPPLNTAALTTTGVVVTHRRSGGGPVLWDAGLLSLDVVLPPGHALALTDVALAYRWLGEVVADALTAVGVTARPVSVEGAREAQRRDDAVAVRARRACFGGLSPFEPVGEDGRKLAGLSQVRRRTGTLFQCGIALDLDTEGLAGLLEEDPAEAAALARAIDRVAVGARVVRPDLTAPMVGAAVEDALLRHRGVRLGSTMEAG